MHALQCQHDVDVHLLFCFDLDLLIASSRGSVRLVFSASILFDWYHFACSAKQKSYAFSTHYHACIAIPTWHRCAYPIFCFDIDLHSLLTRIFFVDPHWWVPLCVQCPSETMPFQLIIMHALQCQHDIDVHLLFCFDLDIHMSCSPRSCLTWIFFVDSHWWVQLCGQRPEKGMPCQQIIMHALPCRHDVDVNLLFCFDLITSSRGRVRLVFSASILIDRYHFACCAQQKLCLFNTLPCMHCSANMKDVHLLFCFDIDLQITSSRGRV